MEQSIKILRNLREITKMLILLEMSVEKVTALKTIAKKLGMTVQGVSEYLKLMSKEGLLHKIGNEYRATKKGIQVLHHNFSQLRDLFEKNDRKLSIIDVCTAIAKDDLETGDKVGLFMEKGVLVAYKNRKSTSIGVANRTAKKGELVAVTNLSGIVTLTQGMIQIIALPPIWKAKSIDTYVNRVRRIYSKFKPDVIGVDCLEARIIAAKLGLKTNIEFAIAQSAVEACQKGLDVMLFTSTTDLHRLVATIEEINTNLPEHIKFELVTV